MGVAFILFARAYDSTKALLQGTLLQTVTESSIG